MIQKPNNLVINFDDLSSPQERLGFITLLLLSENKSKLDNSPLCIRKISNKELSITIEGDIKKLIHEFVYGTPKYRTLIPLEPINDNYINLFHRVLNAYIPKQNRSKGEIKYSDSTLLSLLLTSSGGNAKTLGFSNDTASCLCRMLSLISSLMFVSKSIKKDKTGIYKYYDTPIVVVPYVEDPIQYKDFLQKMRPTSNVVYTMPSEAALEFIYNLYLKALLIGNPGFTIGYIVVLGRDSHENSIAKKIIRFDLAGLSDPNQKTKIASLLYLYHKYRKYLNNTREYLNPNEIIVQHPILTLITSNMLDKINNTCKKRKVFSDVYKASDKIVLNNDKNNYTIFDNYEKVSVLYEILTKFLEKGVFTISHEGKAKEVITMDDAVFFNSMQQLFEYIINESGKSDKDISATSKGLWARFKSYRSNRSALINYLTSLYLKCDEAGIYLSPRLSKYIMEQTDDAVDLILLAIITAYGNAKNKTPLTKEEN